MDTFFRRIAIWEGSSYLLLLLIAMPLKYGLGWDMAVKVVGWAHGLLFIAYVVVLGMCWLKYRWSLRFVAVAFFAALLPAAPFFLKHPGPDLTPEAA